MDKFTKGYIACALWSTNDESDPETGGDPFDDNYGPDDLAEESLAGIIEDCRLFQERRGNLFEGREGEAGHDFWLTRNGHGAGFWDGDWPEPDATILSKLSESYGGSGLELGHDGLIHTYCDGPAAMNAEIEESEVNRAWWKQVGQLIDPQMRLSCWDGRDHASFTLPDMVLSGRAAMTLLAQQAEIERMSRIITRVKA